MPLTAEARQIVRRAVETFNREQLNLATTAIALGYSMPVVANGCIMTAISENGMVLTEDENRILVTELERDDETRLTLLQMGSRQWSADTDEDPEYYN